MIRPAALIVLGATTLVLSGFLLGQDADMRDAGGPGIIGFEFAWDRDRADEIRAEWGIEGEQAARNSLRVDFAYLIAYGGFFVLAAMATRDLALRRRWRRISAFGAVAVPVALAVPVFDAVENAWLLISLEGEGGELAPLAGSVFACLKFAALAVAGTYVVAGLLARVTGRGGPTAGK